MKLIEIRDLDGPNIFMRSPAIKLEFELDDLVDHASVAEQGSAVITQLHARLEQRDVAIRSRLLETPGRLAIAYSWTNRRFALAVADRVAEALGVCESSPDDEALQRFLAAPEPGDRPLMVTDAERRIPIAAITGTNGKTTTTRLLAHTLMRAGKHVGWSSTSGVYIDGVEVLHGDYSGPSGARRVVNDPGVDVGVLETARGGILLRGLACESNDVSVFTNISADHLGLHGIHTVEALAEVKAVVCHTTRPDGVAVLNADDPLVVASTRSVKARNLFFSKDLSNPLVAESIVVGRPVLRVQGGAVEFVEGDDVYRFRDFTQIPSTYGGRAEHMVENVMAAIGAAIGLGLPLGTIDDALSTFRNSFEQNPGRLNVFDLDGVTVVLDFAHNEAGLIVLLDFARRFLGPDGRLTVLIGTAGDRTDESLREIGRISGAGADRSIIKRTKKYERGRTNEEMIALYREGAALAGHPEIEVAGDEVEGLAMALSGARKGDVIALMAQEQVDLLAAELLRRGRPAG